MKQTTPAAACIMIVCGGLFGGCTSDADHRSTMKSDHSTNAGDAADPMSTTHTATAVSSTTPDERMLSIFLAKDQDEIKIGRLAQQKATSDSARALADALVTDHSEHLDKVRALVSSTNITPLSSEQVSDLLRVEKGERTPPKDPMAKLQGLSGKEFDRAFGKMMLEGHRELIQNVEKSRGALRDQSVRDLVDETLPVLRKHEQLAEQIVSGGSGGREMGGGGDERLRRVRSAFHRPGRCSP